MEQRIAANKQLIEKIGKFRCNFITNYQNYGKNIKSKTNSVLTAEDQRSILTMISIFMVEWTRSAKKFVLILKNCRQMCYFGSQQTPS